MVRNVSELFLTILLWLFFLYLCSLVSMGELVNSEEHLGHGGAFHMEEKRQKGGVQKGRYFYSCLIWTALLLDSLILSYAAAS